jgi:hypothetical protein
LVEAARQHGIGRAAADAAVTAGVEAYQGRMRPPSSPRWLTGGPGSPKTRPAESRSGMMSRPTSFGTFLLGIGRRSRNRRALFDRFTLTDVVRQVVGVGSVGMRVYLVLVEGRTGADLLFLQLKQAGPAVYEAHTRPSPYSSHGERVIAGKRLLRSATDIFVGWGTLNGYDYYVRQFRDMKIVPSTELIASIASGKVESRPD